MIWFFPVLNIGPPSRSVCGRYLSWCAALNIWRVLPLQRGIPKQNPIGVSLKIFDYTMIDDELPVYNTRKINNVNLWGSVGIFRIDTVCICITEFSRGCLGLTSRPNSYLSSSRMMGGVMVFTYYWMLSVSITRRENVGVGSGKQLACVQELP